MTDKYIRWDTPGLEKGQGSEEDTLINEVASQINTAQKAVWECHRHAFSGTHVKTQAVVKGTLKVLDELPAHLRQGLFANAGKVHPIAMRYSTETTDLIDDRVPQPRGIGLKVSTSAAPS